MGLQMTGGIWFIAPEVQEQMQQEDYLCAKAHRIVHISTCIVRRKYVDPIVRIRDIRAKVLGINEMQLPETNRIPQEAVNKRHKWREHVGSGVPEVGPPHQQIRAWRLKNPI